MMRADMVHSLLLLRDTSWEAADENNNLVL